MRPSTPASLAAAAKSASPHRTMGLKQEKSTTGHDSSGVTSLSIASHYYKNVDLSRLGNPCCPDFPTGNASPGQKGVLFCPGSGNRDKRASAHVAGAQFCPGLCYQPGQKVIFFPVFLFSILFLFQLYFCISIKLMYWNSVCMISTNIYIYIYSYLYIFFLDSFHI